MTKKLLFMLAGLFAISFPVGAFPSVTPLWTNDHNTIVDPHALTINSYGWAINGLPYQQEAVLTFCGWQYMAFYRGAGTADTIHGHVCIARRRLAENPGFRVETTDTPAQSKHSFSCLPADWQIIELSDYTFTSNDAHNMISMGICPNDGTIHLSFDHHGADLHYRISQIDVATHPDSVTWEASLFGPTHSDLISGQSIVNVTYPRFWQTPSGDLQIGWRTGISGDGDWYIGDYDGTTHLWTETHQVINRAGSYNDGTSSGSERNPYMNAPTGYDSNGRLHITWTWREGSDTANHDIMYAYSDDGGDSWHNNGGVEIGNLSTLITLDSPGVKAVTLSTDYGMMNQQSQAIDSNNNVHVLMWHCTGSTPDRFGQVGDRRYYHYWRNVRTGIWTRNTLEFDLGNVNSYVGTRPKIFIRDNGDAYAIYQSFESIALTSEEIYLQYGNLVIQAATAANHWNDWRIVHTQIGPFVSEALVDPCRFKDGILSVMMQDSPDYNCEWTPLRLLEFQLKN